MREERDRGWGVGKGVLKGMNPLVLKVEMEMEAQAGQRSRERR